MTKEEKRAIEDSRCLIYELSNHKDKDFIGRLYYKNKPIEENLEILLNLIEKLQKENEELLEVKVSASAHNRILELEKENEELKEYKRNVEKNYKKENKQLKNTIAIVDKLEERIKENFVPKERIKNIIEKISVYKKLAKESIEHKIVIADSDSLEYGRMQAHSVDMSMLQDLLKESEE